MMNVNDIVDRYVAVWNEPNADERRRRIRALWSVDGMTCHRLLESRGHDAIETRVTGSWDKWLRGSNYVFRPKPDAACHHGAVRVNWEMVKVPGGDVEAAGVSFLLLDPDGRIRSDYQFPSP